MSALPRVLIVEDVDAMRELLEHVIRESARFQVSGSARNGAELRFELLRRRPDFVLLDEVLPGESSFELLEELRRDEVPVILLTSLEERTPADVPLPPGALDRLLKPGWKNWATEGPVFIGAIAQALQSVGLRIG